MARPKFGTPEWDKRLGEELVANLNRNVMREEEERAKNPKITPQEQARRRAEIAAHNKARADKLAKEGKKTS